MSVQHLSDEAVAAFADGVLTGHARERATRHSTQCPECAYAVAEQRAAVWALRAAPAPSLPTGLLDRLRSVPSTTPIDVAPSALGPDGSAMFAAFGTVSPVDPSTGAAKPMNLVGAAALVPAVRPDGRHRIRPIVLTAAAVAAAGVVAVGSTAHASPSQSRPTRTRPAVQAGFVQPVGGGASIQPADVRVQIGP